MKNFIITITTKGNGKYDTLTMAKVLSNVIAFSADLYSIDYHGIEHGIFMYYEEEEEIDIIAVQKEIDNLEAELAEVQVKMKEYLKELGM